VRAYQTVCELQGAPDPPNSPGITAEHIVPVEIGSARFHRGGDVAEPKRATHAMPQRVDAEQTQMVFRREDSYGTQHLRAVVKAFEAAVVKLFS